MPYIKVDEPETRRIIRRTALAGPPNAGKTTSLRTWPGPLTVVSAPMEEGIASVPRKTTDGLDVTSLVYKIPPEKEGVDFDWATVTKEFKTAVFDSIKAKTKTLAIDGLHHVHRMFANEATFGALAKGTDFQPSLWGNAHSRFFTFLEQVQKTGVEYVVVTVWDALEKDNPDDKGSSPSRHILPDLAGAAAKKFMGTWSTCFYATLENGKYVWLTKPKGQVWGATVKLPLEIAEKVPQTIPQDYGAFERGIEAALVGKAWPQ